MLIHKSGDKDDPANYRPIALTQTTVKLFHSIITNRMQAFTRSNNIIDTKVQKGFLNDISDCAEHSIVLQSILRNARRTKHAMHSIWLDLRNAFGSVRHDYLRFIAAHYHLPAWFRTYINNFYYGITACIKTPTYCTKSILLNSGVVIDMLSPILFLLCINPMLKYLSTEKKHGFKLSK